ncbi:MAG: hypothetical protein FD134_2224 [Gallionellaceae bacterium]|nr:MAG: hypothetical protein FD134_2224 [Gallionellaceae bacterium]
MWRFLRNALGFLVASTVLMACATATQPDEMWMDPSYRSLPKKIMVVGVSRKPVNRRIFEDEFVRQITAHNVEAVASYTVLPDELQGDHNAIAGKVKEMGADTVLITRVTGKKTVKTYVPGFYPPPYYGTWPDYYGYGYNAMYSPGFMAEEEITVIETNLYDASNDRLIWGSTTEVVKRGSSQDRINRYIGIVMKAMAAQGLFY